MKFTAKTLFALVGAVLALVMMLLPFATFSAFGMSESAMGFKILFADADGMYVPFFVWVSFLAGLAGIVLLFLGKNCKISGVCFAVAAVAGLLYGVTFRSADLGFGISVSLHAGAGAWLAMVFHLVAAAFALFGDLMPFLHSVPVGGVTEKLDSAAAAFQKTTGSVADSIKSAAASHAASGARICPQCGAKVDAESNFCLACGAKLEQTPAAKFCAACGAQLDPEARFCASCGASAQE